MTPRLTPQVRLRTALTSALCILVLAGCSSDDDDSADPTTPPGEDGGPGGDIGGDTGGGADADTLAFVAGSVSVNGEGTGQIERLSLGEGAGSIVSTGVTEATGSDIRVATDGEDVYQIGRFQIDSLTRYSTEELRDPVWQYSVNGEEVASNPYDVVFASETKAYVIRYGSPFVWIVDPTAERLEDFKTGEIDLGAYDTNDGVPNMSDAVLVGDRLFVLMQRLDETLRFAPTLDGYVAVIDTTTDEEIDTGRGEGGLPGIALETSNPEGLYHFEAANELHVVGRGNIFENENVLEDGDVVADPYDGGLETIDLDTLETGLLFDDGTAEDNRGFLADALVVSPDKGYALFYESFRVTTLRAFNPLSGVVSDDVVAGLEDVDVSTLAVAPDGLVWVGLPDETAPGFTVLDPSDDSVALERVATEFDPLNVVFVTVPAEGDSPDGN